MAFYERHFIITSKQDFGHIGSFHDATGGVVHSGMFIFDVGTNKFCHFDLTLKVEYLFRQYSFDCSVGKFTLGTFLYPELIAEQSFIDEASLENCGWQPKAGPVECFFSQIVDDQIHLAFHTICDESPVGVLFEPACLDDLNDHFLLKFDPESSFIDCWNVVANALFSDQDSEGVDKARDCNYSPYNSPEIGLVYEHINPNVFFSKFDRGNLVDNPYKLRLWSVDYGQNFSMQVQNIKLSDSGRIREIYGFNGYTERYYYPDSGRLYERMSIKKLNFVTWSGLLVEWPWCSLLWYGEIYLFADLEEFNLCCRTHFKEHGDDVCPVCGKPLGKQWKYSFIDITRLPHQIYFCSKDCLHGFERHMLIYLDRLTKPNMKYWLNDGLV